MLSRVADALYWIGRYAERIETNEAISILNEECCKYDTCSCGCPFLLEKPNFRGNYCALDNSPDNWKKVEE